MDNGSFKGLIQGSVSHPLKFPGPYKGIFGPDHKRLKGRNDQIGKGQCNNRLEDHSIVAGSVSRRQKGPVFTKYGKIRVDIKNMAKNGEKTTRTKSV